MRIGMMADIYKPHISGVTNYISQYKTHFEAQGHEIYVFTFGDEGDGPGEERVIRSPGLPLTLRYGDKDYPVNLRYSTRARRLLQSMDLVHVHHPFLSGPLALGYCRPARIPVVFTNHTRYDLYAQAFFPQIPGGVGRAFLEAYLPPFCKACDHHSLNHDGGYGAVIMITATCETQSRTVLRRLPRNHAKCADSRSHEVAEVDGPAVS